MLFANQSVFFLLLFLFFVFVGQKKGERKVEISSCSCIKPQPNTPFFSWDGPAGAFPDLPFKYCSHCI